MNYHDETLAIARQRAAEIAAQFEDEVARLVQSGALPENGYNRAALFGAAIDNIADRFGFRNDAEYKNLRKF